MELLAGIKAVLSSQAAQNALDATGGGILAAIFGGRKTPAKLVLSGIVAAICGWYWGGFTCDWIFGECSDSAYRGFSAGIGVFSWPVLSRIDGIVDAVKSKWLSK